MVLSLSELNFSDFKHPNMYDMSRPFMKEVLSKFLLFFNRRVIGSTLKLHLNFFSIINKAPDIRATDKPTRTFECFYVTVLFWRKWDANL